MAFSESPNDRTTVQHPEKPRRYGPEAVRSLCRQYILTVHLDAAGNATRGQRPRPTGHLGRSGGLRQKATNSGLLKNWRLTPLDYIPCQNFHICDKGRPEANGW